MPVEVLRLIEAVFVRQNRMQFCISRGQRLNLFQIFFAVFILLATKTMIVSAWSKSHSSISRIHKSFRLLSTSAPASAQLSTMSEGTKQQKDNDIRYMKLALRLAQHAYREKEVPIGAVVVDSEGNIVSTGRNEVEEKHDATAHAEINALKYAAEHKKNWRLMDCTLYTTLEPCMMCLGAIQSFRIARVVYAAKDLRLGACGSWQPLHDLKHPIHQIVDISGGVCEEDSAVLLRRFFSALRTEKFRYPGYDLGRGVCEKGIEAELAAITESESHP